MKRVALLVMVVAVVGLYFLFAPRRAQTGDDPEGVKKEAPGPEAAVSTPRSPASVSAPSVSLGETPLAEEEKRSLAKLASLLARREKMAPKDLYLALNGAGLHPVVTKDSNPETGTLLTVRTGNALPGTRYFHGQMFEDADGSSHLQHASFEIRPGSDSMTTARQLLDGAFGGLGKPLIERADYVLWRAGPGRVVSVKRLGADELQENIFNAHAPEDVGTLWVVSEDEPEHID